MPIYKRLGEFRTAKPRVLAASCCRNTTRYFDSSEGETFKCRQAGKSLASDKYIVNAQFRDFESSATVEQRAAFHVQSRTRIATRRPELSVPNRVSVRRLSLELSDN